MVTGGVETGWGGVVFRVGERGKREEKEREREALDTSAWSLCWSLCCIPSQDINDIFQTRIITTALPSGVVEGEQRALYSNI